MKVTKKILGFIGSLAIVASFAAPAFASGGTGSPSLTCERVTDAGGSTQCVYSIGASPESDGDEIYLYQNDDCSGSVRTASNISGTETVNNPGGLFDSGNQFDTYSAKNNDNFAGCIIFNFPTTFQISTMFSAATMETTATTAVTQVGPYVLAIFGILIIVGIAMAILKKATRGVIGSIDGKGDRKGRKRDR